MSIVINEDNIINNSSTRITDSTKPTIEYDGDWENVYVAIIASSLNTVNIEISPNLSEPEKCTIEKLTSQQYLYALHLKLKRFYYSYNEPSVKTYDISLTATPGDAALTKSSSFSISQMGCEKTHKITWKDYQGNTIKTDDVKDGTIPTCAEPTKPADEQYSYTFAGWTDGTNVYPTGTNLPAVTGDTTYTATYTTTVNQYTVTFKNEDGTVLQSSQVEYGMMPSYNDTTPTKPADAQYTYTFAGWTNGTNVYPTGTNLPAVTGNATYYANFTDINRLYTVTINPNDSTYGTINRETLLEVPYNTTISGNGNRIKIGNETIIATPASSTEQYEYKFNRWEAADNAVSVKKNLTITAVFSRELRKYTVTWKNSDGTVLETDTDVSYGTSPIYNGSTPYKEDDENYSYAFTGWTPEITNVRGDTTYTATYKSTRNTVNVNFYVSPNESYGKINGQATYSCDVPYGTTVTIAGNVLTLNTGCTVVANPTTGCIDYSYSFSGWSGVNNNQSITSPTDITAKFSREQKTYTVNFVSNNTRYGTVSPASVSNVPYGTTVTSLSQSTITVNGTTVTATPKQSDTEGLSYTFKEWGDGTSITVTGDTTITAVFKVTASEGYYAVDFDLNYPEAPNSIATQVVPIGGNAEKPNGTISRPGYYFGGWFENLEDQGAGFDFLNETITGNTTLYAKWFRNVGTNQLGTVLINEKLANSSYTKGIYITIENGGIIYGDNIDNVDGYYLEAVYDNQDIYGAEITYFKKTDNPTPTYRWNHTGQKSRMYIIGKKYRFLAGFENENYQLYGVRLTYKDGDVESQEIKLFDDNNFITKLGLIDFTVKAIVFEAHESTHIEVLIFDPSA